MKAGFRRQGRLKGIDVVRSNWWDSELEMLVPGVCFQMFALNVLLQKETQGELVGG